MNTKIISSWLFVLALFTPLGVWAAGGSNTEKSCQATFSVSDQTLTIPCVEVVMGNETVLYSAQLQQVEEGRFALTQVAELSAAVESDCVASYSLETGELGVPCVEGGNPHEVGDLVLYADVPASPSVFFVSEGEFPVLSLENGRNTRKSSASLPYQVYFSAVNSQRCTLYSFKATTSTLSVNLFAASHNPKKENFWVDLYEDGYVYDSLINTQYGYVDGETRDYRFQAAIPARYKKVV